MRDKIKEIAIKTIKTMCETAVGCIGSSVVLSDVSWKYVVSASILSGITTVLINISQLKEWLKCGHLKQLAINFQINILKKQLGLRTWQT